MARRHRSTRTSSTTASPSAPRWHSHALGLLVLLVEVAVVEGLADPFRAIKDALAVGGLAVLLALWLLGRLRRHRATLPAGPLAAVLVAYPILLAASATWAASSARAEAAAATAAVWVAAALLLATWTADERATVTTWATAGVLASAAVLALQVAGVHLLVVGLEGRADRLALTGLSGNPADLAMAAVLLLPLLLARLLEHGGRRWPWLVAAALAAATVITRTLTAVVALGALLLVLLVLRRSRRAWLASAGAVVIVVGIGLIGGLGGRLHTVVAAARSGDWYQVLSARGDGWTAAAQMVADHPVLGVGGACYTQVFYPERLAWLEARGTTGRRGEKATHFPWAHCDPLQVVVELGIAGTLWLVALLLALVRRSRATGGPLPLLAAAAWAPLLLLHFPTHLAVGLVPAVLTLAALLEGEPRVQLPQLRSLAGMAVALVVVAAAAAVTGWQLHLLRVGLWRGRAQAALATVNELRGPRRSNVLLALERDARKQVAEWPGDAPWLWRIVGRAALGRGSARPAEQAFRTAYALWPHEEADLGLGLALAAQDRASEAMVHLTRVSRVNPALTALIPEEPLRSAVEDLTAKWGADRGWHSPRHESRREPDRDGSAPATPAGRQQPPRPPAEGR